jgi:hypothetical protein
MGTLIATAFDRGAQALISARFLKEEAESIPAGT